MQIILSRTCWVDREETEFLIGWFKCFLAKVGDHYPHADIRIQEYGLCIDVRAESEEKEQLVERHLHELAAEALFEWANQYRSTMIQTQQ